MKGEDKMKQTIMGIGLIVGVLVGFVPSVDAQTQKKPVDIEACMSWKRVESPDISPTGRWVTYRIAPMEYNPENTDAKTVHLFGYLLTPTYADKPVEFDSLTSPPPLCSRQKLALYSTYII